MNLIDLLLYRGYIQSSITTLELWNRKKPNARAKEMAQQLGKAFNGLDQLEKMYIKQKELTSTVKTIKDLEIAQLKKEIAYLKEKNKSLEGGL